MNPKFSQYLEKDSILILDGTSKREILEDLISAAADKSKVDRDIIQRLTWKREKMMTTGLGNGFALPHIRITGIPEPVLLFAVCKNEISDYQTQDKIPIRVLVYIIAPEGDQNNYLKLIGSISSRLRTKEVIDEVIENISRPAQILKFLKKKANE